MRRGGCWTAGRTGSPAWPPDAGSISLVGHLRRIGCVTTTAWPLPDEVAASDIVEHDSRESLRRLFRGLRRQAMSKRMSLEDMAAAIINAHDLLRARPPG